MILSRGRFRAAALAVILTALALGGCAAEGPRNSTGQVTASAPADSFSLQVGDCTGSLTSGTVEKVMLVPCSEPHSWEAFAVTDLDGDKFPGAGAVQDAAEEYCRDGFKRFIGQTVGKSEYDLTVLQPTRQTWESAGDRAVTCLAGKDGGKIEGTLRDVGK